MDKKILLVDHISYLTPSSIIQESTGIQGKNLILKGIIQKAETQNGNGRIYRYSTLMREVQKYIDGPVQMNNALAELDHPDTSVVELKNVSHKINKIWWEGNNVLGEIELLPTPSGLIAKALVDSGVPLGISSRGMGSIRQIGETIEVGDDFDLLCFDLVSIPSTPGAYLHPVTDTSLNEAQVKKVIDTSLKYGKVNDILSIFSTKK